MRCRRRPKPTSTVGSLPDVDRSEIRDGIVKAFADTALEVSNAGNRNFVAPSSIGPEILGPVERVTKELFGDIPVIPTMSTGATDSQPFRQIGIPSYGVSGLMGDPEDIRVARPGRADADQELLRRAGVPAAADEDSLTGQTGHLGIRALRSALEKATEDAHGTQIGAAMRCTRRLCGDIV